MKQLKNFQKINKGGCAQFALIVSDLFNLPNFYLFYENKKTNFPSHVGINLGNEIYDPEGIYKIGKLKNVIRPATIEQVKEYRKDLGDKYDQKELEDFIKNIKNSLKENLVSHAQEELNRAGLLDKDADYGGMIGIAVLQLIKTMAEQGHSGFSAAWVRELFNKLSNYETLTPITSDSSEWVDVSNMCDGEKMWQNRRNPAIFSVDGGNTWYHVDDKEKIMEGINLAIRTFNQILVEKKNG